MVVMPRNGSESQAQATSASGRRVLPHYLKSEAPPPMLHLTATSTAQDLHPTPTACSHAPPLTNVSKRTSLRLTAKEDLPPSTHPILYHSTGMQILKEAPHSSTDSLRKM